MKYFYMIFMILLIISNILLSHKLEIFENSLYETTTILESLHRCMVYNISLEHCTMSSEEIGELEKENYKLCNTESIK